MVSCLPLRADKKALVRMGMKVSVSVMEDEGEGDEGKWRNEHRVFDLATKMTGPDNLHFQAQTDTRAGSL